MPVSSIEISSSHSCVTAATDHQSYIHTSRCQKRPMPRGHNRQSKKLRSLFCSGRKHRRLARPRASERKFSPGFSMTSRCHHEIRSSRSDLDYDDNDTLFFSKSSVAVVIVETMRYGAKVAWPRSNSDHNGLLVKAQPHRAVAVTSLGCICTTAPLPGRADAFGELCMRGHYRPRVPTPPKQQGAVRGGEFARRGCPDDRRVHSHRISVCHYQQCRNSSPRPPKRHICECWPVSCCLQHLWRKKDIRNTKPE
jgi:hypothetical protein